MKTVYFSLVVSSSLFLSGCGMLDDDSSSSGNNGATSKMAWEVHESKDEFTDKVSRYYTTEPISGSARRLQLNCAKDGTINLYFDFMEREGIPFGSLPEVATVRIDSGKSHEEPWRTIYVEGTSWPINTKAFIDSLVGHEKLAVEVFSGGRAAFDITGFGAALDGMREAGCKDDAPKSAPSATPTTEAYSPPPNDSGSAASNAADAVLDAAHEANNAAQGAKQAADEALRAAKGL